MIDKITGPLFKWFGSKWNASKYYPSFSHENLVEPFAGSASFSLRHHKKNVIIAEANLHINQLWNWIINESTETLIREIPINIKEGTDIRSLGLSKGQQLLLKNWQRTNNVGNCWTISPWGNKPGQWTENTRNRVSVESQFIKHWQLYNTADFVFMNCNKDNVSWFIDPPYQYNYNYKLPIYDYAMLKETIVNLRGEYIVCEAICPKTNKRPTWLNFVDFRKTVTSRRKKNNSHHSRELIYTNL